MYGFSWWVYKTTSAFKKGEPLPKMDLRRKVNFKSALFYLDGILILGGLAFSSSMSAFVGFMISFRTHCSNFTFL